MRANAEPTRQEVSVPTDRDRDLLRLRMISLAQERGLSWAQIARSIGAKNGKTLKNETKHLARRLERQLRAEAQKTVA